MPMPDVSGADLRGAKLQKTNVRRMDLDGVDLRGASLESCEGLALSSVNLEGASFNYVYIEAAVNCDFRLARVRNCHFDNNCHLDQSDFTGANISETIFFYDSSGTGLVFKNARTHKIEFRRCKLPGADFRGADLTSAEMDSCDFSGATFQGAILSGALLHKAKLKNADLRKADLSNANLAGADLSGANIDGADFTGANVAGIKLAGVDTSRAKGLKLALAPAAAQAGHSVQQLASITKQSGWLQTSIKAEGKGELTVTMEVTTRDKGKTAHGCSIEGEKYLGRQHECVGTTLSNLFTELAGQWVPANCSSILSAWISRRAQSARTRAATDCSGRVVRSLWSHPAQRRGPTGQPGPSPRGVHRSSQEGQEGHRGMERRHQPLREGGQLPGGRSIAAEPGRHPLPNTGFHGCTIRQSSTEESCALDMAASPSSRPAFAMLTCPRHR